MRVDLVSQNSELFLALLGEWGTGVEGCMCFFSYEAVSYRRVDGEGRLVVGEGGEGYLVYTKISTPEYICLQNAYKTEPTHQKSKTGLSVDPK